MIKYSILSLAFFVGLICKLLRGLLKFPMVKGDIYEFDNWLIHGKYSICFYFYYILLYILKVMLLDTFKLGMMN